MARRGGLLLAGQPVGRQLAHGDPAQRRRHIFTLGLGDLNSGGEQLGVALGRETAFLCLPPVGGVIADAVQRCAARGLVSP